MIQKCTAFLWVLGMVTLCGRARADGNGLGGDAARDAYDQGAAAYEAHEYARAAKLLARADELRPNPVALNLALAAALKADDALSGMTLVLRAEQRAVDGSLAELAREGRARFESRVGFVRIVCAERRPCQARVGERAASDGERVPVLPGSVEVVFSQRPAAVAEVVTVTAKSTVDVKEPSPPPTATPTPTPMSHVAPPPRREERGLPPSFFFGAAATTVLVGGATAVSAFDVQSQHEAFLESSQRTSEAKERGQSGEVRTNVLLAATVVAVVGTTVLGLFFTRWGHRSRVAGAPSTAFVF